MAELIDKKALIDKFEEVKWKCDKLSDVAQIVGVQAVIDAISTTTEAEIRAKAIDEFAEKLKRNFRDIGAFTGYEVKREIDEFAEQLKEE